MTLYLSAYIAMFAATMFGLMTLTRWRSGIAQSSAANKTLAAIADELAAIDLKHQAGDLSDDDARANRMQLLSSYNRPSRIAPKSIAIIACLACGAALLAVQKFDGLEESEPGAFAAVSPVDDEESGALREFVRSTASAVPLQINGPMSLPNDQRSLPDVDSMISALAKRLESEPDDWQGWQMLGWSYLHTDRFSEAERAYARAVSLKPDSTEIRAAYEEAKGRSAGVASAEQTMPDQTQQDMIRSMVEQLATRLQSSPRDLEGWIKLIRSRKVLGENDAAIAALKQGLAAFNDSPEQQTRLADAAQQLGVTGD